MQGRAIEAGEWCITEIESITEQRETEVREARADLVPPPRTDEFHFDEVTRD